MGYELHITRAESWGDPCPDPIDEQRWLDQAKEVADLVCVGWIGVRDGDDGPTLSWEKGEIVVSGATKAHLGELVALALHLHARLQGDDAEFYD
jgi:hypothetical protein